MTNLDQVFILALALISMSVTVGLIRKKDVWEYIILYWIVLFIKNAINFAATL